MTTQPLKITDLDHFKAEKRFPPDYPTDRRTFYSPVDDVHGVLCALVKSATRTLTVAMYGFDDVELSRAILGKMQQEGVIVQITLDSSQAAGRAEKAILDAWLDPQTATPLTSVVSVGRSERGAIQHLKMLVVDGLWVVTGSTNWSDGGESKQDNQLTVAMSRAEAHEAEYRIAHIHLAQLQAAAAKEKAHAR